ncbi:MAG: DUF1189 family protein [Candidatus Theseobacter exili]|nr:DUF1189 family protein [Candidatus Theseobacter exili]
MKVSAEFLSSIWKSCTSFQFYSDAAQKSLGYAVKFFFFMIILYSLIMITLMSPAIFKGIPEAFNWAIRNFPQIEIQSGKAQTIGLQKPFKQVWPGEFALIIDTTDQNKNLPSTVPSGILVLSDRIIMKNPSFERQFLYPANWNFSVDTAFLMKWKARFYWPVLPVVLLFVPIYFVLSKSFQILVFGLVFIFFGRFVRKTLPGEIVFKLSIFALCPALVLTLMVLLLGVVVPFFDFLYYGIYVAFFLGGANALTDGISEETEE